LEGRAKKLDESNLLVDRENDVLDASLDSHRAIRIVSKVKCGKAESKKENPEHAFSNTSRPISESSL